MDEYNPWWVGKQHWVYQDWLESEVRWVPHIISMFDVKPFSLNFLIGPRQIGKTTAIMIYIHERLLKMFKPESIFYISCDELSDYHELGELLDSYLRFRDNIGVRSSVIFIDEVTFVDEWWRALKSRIDQGKLKNDVIFVSGSASIDLIAGKERFPGRRGHGEDYYLLPLTFNEYEKSIKKRRIVEKPVSLNNLGDLLDANRLLKKTIENDFQEYLATGGFPLSIKEYYKRGTILESYKTYLDWLRTDIIKNGKSDKVARDLVGLIIRSRLSPLSWNTLGKEIGLSPNTVRSYIEFLENIFFLKTQMFMDPNGKVYRRKNKKIHITDPFLYDMAARWTRENVTEEQKVESLVATHIARITEIYYWRNSTEIDIIIKTNDNKLYGIEVKWTLKPTITRRPIKTITLKKDDIPLFLATAPIRSSYTKKL